jgi:hypothetical protein
MNEPIWHGWTIRAQGGAFIEKKPDYGIWELA